MRTLEKTTPGAARRKEDPHNGRPTGSSLKQLPKLLASNLFLLLILIDTFRRDFSIFLIMLSEAFSDKTQTISLPYPGLTALN
jgi:hypothetical protein